MNATRAVSRRGVWGRFDRDDQGRWIVRLKTVQLVTSTVISVATVFGIMLAAVGVFSRPYLEDITRDVVTQETAGLAAQMAEIPSVYETRKEHENEMLEINRKLDSIAGEIRRVDNRILTQSERTDSLMRDLMRVLRER